MSGGFLRRVQSARVAEGEPVMVRRANGWPLVAAWAVWWAASAGGRAQELAPPPTPVPAPPEVLTPAPAVQPAMVIIPPPSHAAPPSCAPYEDWNGPYLIGDPLLE